MKVRDIMSSDVDCVRPNDTVQEAAIKMDELNLGLLPVGVNAPDIFLGNAGPMAYPAPGDSSKQAD